MSSNFVNIEVIQTLPFSNANRDDAGQPKSVLFGGSTRGRLSSQSLKRAARFYGADSEAGFRASDRVNTSFYRTRYIKALVLASISDRHGEDVAKASEKAVETIVGKDLPLGNKDSKNADLASTLVVLTNEEIDAIADLLVEQGKASAKEIENILATSSKKDLALWGRFFASSNASTIDGSAQVAHAITTHSVAIEPDFFVGMDDAADFFSDHAGGGHPGDSFYLQGTFYKYANFNIEETVLNLVNANLAGKTFSYDEGKADGIEEVVEAITEKFITAFSLAVPQGKIRSTAHTTLPSMVRVSVTANQPVNAVTAFEEPVSGKAITSESIAKLNAEVASFEAFLGKPLASYVLVRGEVEADALGEQADSMVSLIESVKQQVRPIVTRTVENLSR